MSYNANYAMSTSIRATNHLHQVSNFEPPVTLWVVLQMCYNNLEN